MQVGYGAKNGLEHENPSTAKFVLKSINSSLKQIIIYI
jgi:hypothetical protein